MKKSKSASPIETKLRMILAEVFICDEHELALGTKLREDISSDSIEFVEMAMSIEEAFGIGEIPECVVARMETFGDVLAYVKKHAVAEA
jgi:acyl carrier protein